MQGNAHKCVSRNVVEYHLLALKRSAWAAQEQYPAASVVYILSDKDIGRPTNINQVFLLNYCETLLKTAFTRNHGTVVIPKMSAF